MTAFGWVVLSLLETSAEALLFAFLLTALEWRNVADERTPAYAVVTTAFLMAPIILLYLFLTGYMITTAAFRVMWKGKNLWSYPTSQRPCSSSISSFSVFPWAEHSNRQ